MKNSRENNTKCRPNTMIDYTKHETNLPFKIILGDRVIDRDGTVFFFKNKIDLKKCFVI
jgi:hypothetical protein